MSNLAINLRLRRTKLELTQKELALRAGVSQQLIHSLETGVIRTTKSIGEIARALSCGVADLDPKEEVQDGFGESHLPPVMRPGDLPIYAAYETEDAVAASASTPIDFISRPFPLLNVRGGYGVLVVTNLLFPEFEPGDYALVNPHLPPVPNTTCVFYGDRPQGAAARIRRLIGMTAENWETQCWNPQSPDEAIAKLGRNLWQKCHRIVGRYVRR